MSILIILHATSKIKTETIHCIYFLTYRLRRSANDLLQAAQNQMREKSESVTKLYEQMHWLETSADEVKFQVLQLQERLRDEQQRSAQHFDEAEMLRSMCHL